MTTSNTLNYELEKFYKTHGLEKTESVIADWYLGNASNAGCQETANMFLQKAYTIHSEQTLYWLASFYKSQYKNEDATNYYLKAFEINPNNRSMWPEIGEHILRYGQPDEVMGFYKKLYSIDPSYRPGRFILSSFDYFTSLVTDISEFIGRENKAKFNKSKLLISAVFWGPKYVETFLNYLLPSLLAEGNLPHVYKDYEIYFIILTKKDDAGLFESHWSFREIKKYANLLVTHFPDNLLSYALDFSEKNYKDLGEWSKNPITLLTNIGHYAVIECARILDGDVLTLWPDHIYSESFLTNIVRLMKQDICAISGVCFRLYYSDEFLSEIDKRHRDENGHLSIPSKEMFELLIKYLPEPNYVESRAFSTYPIYLCWKVADEGVIAHVNHYSPWLIRGSYLDGPVFPSLDPTDGFFLERKLMNKEKIALMPEEAMAFDLGDNPLVSYPTNQGYNPIAVSIWFKRWYSSVNEMYFKNCLKFKIGNDKSGEWDRVSAIAKDAVNNIIQLTKEGR